MPHAPALRVRDLSPSDWPVLEHLFGPRGACGGCWCMTWRVPSGKAWEAAKGEPNRRAFRALVETGAAHGVLAFDGDEPVGWCNLGPRADFARLLRSRVLQTPSEATWAVTCFYVPARRRGQGVAGLLLGHAVGLARRRGAPALEGYPVDPSGGARAAGASIPAAFAWTGVRALFERAGFRDVTPAGGTRAIYRRTFRRKRA